MKRLLALVALLLFFCSVETTCLSEETAEKQAKAKPEASKQLNVATMFVNGMT